MSVFGYIWRKIVEGRNCGSHAQTAWVSMPVWARSPSTWVRSAVPMFLLAAAVGGAGATRVSSECSRLHPTDAVLLIDMQNCFMEERPVRDGGTPGYGLDASMMVANGTLRAGPLQVADSSSIIDVGNEWMDLAASAGAQVLITLDWHPADHCSFCNVQYGGVSPPFFCYSGSVIVHAYNASLRCIDAVSERDWSAQQYYQWSSHCVAGSFGARLDPYLRPPADAMFIKLGVHHSRDSYSAFDGGRRRAAPPHDTQATGDSLANLDDASVDLESLVSGGGVRRLFLMGLATDFVVKNTMLDSIGANSEMPPTYTHNRAPPGLQQSVLVDAGTRGIFPVPSLLAKEAFTRGGGVVVTATAAADALAQLCAGTCDVHADCNTTEYCIPLAPRWEWGQCTLCPGNGCLGRGVCMEGGTCACDDGYVGAGCEEIDRTKLMIWVAAMLSAVVLIVLAVVGLCRLKRKDAQVLHLASGMKKVCLAHGEELYDVFLSHTWSTGQDAVHYIKRELKRLVPGVRVFLDVDDLKTIDKLEQHVGESALILLFLSGGYFDSRNVRRELQATVDGGKPTLLVHSDNEKKGGASLQVRGSLQPATSRI